MKATAEAYIRCPFCVVYIRFMEEQANADYADLIIIYNGNCPGICRHSAHGRVQILDLNAFHCVPVTMDSQNLPWPPLRCIREAIKVIDSVKRQDN